MDILPFLTGASPLNHSTHYLEHQALGLASSSVHTITSHYAGGARLFASARAQPFVGTSLGNLWFSPHFRLLLLRSLPCSAFLAGTAQLCLRGALLDLLSTRAQPLLALLWVLSLPIPVILLSLHLALCGWCSTLRVGTCSTFCWHFHGFYLSPFP